LDAYKERQGYLQNDPLPLLGSRGVGVKTPGISIKKMGSDDILSHVHLILFEDADISGNKICPFIRKFALIASREIGDRVHYHIALVLPAPMTRKAFYKWLKDNSEMPHLKGTTHFKTVNWFDYGKHTDLEQYICKGMGPCWDNPEHRPEMIVNKTIITSKEYHRAFHARSPAKAAVEKNRQEHKRGNQCIDLIATKYVGCEDVVQLPVIVKEVMEHYEGRLQDNQLFSLVQAIMFKVNKIKTINLAIVRMVQKFS